MNYSMDVLLGAIKSTYNTPLLLPAGFSNKQQPKVIRKSQARSSFEAAEMRFQILTTKT